MAINKLTATIYYDNELYSFHEMLQLLEEVKGVRRIEYDPTWPGAKCVECGYMLIHKHGYQDCRRFNFHKTTRNDPACPAFVRRPPAQATGDEEGG